MTCRVYVGEYQDRITGAAATAYVVIDENGRLVKAMAQKVKTNKGLSLQAVKLAVQGLCYLHGMDEAMLCMDSPTALAALRQEWKRLDEYKQVWRICSRNLAQVLLKYDAER